MRGESQVRQRGGADGSTAQLCKQQQRIRTPLASGGLAIVRPEQPWSAMRGSVRVRWTASRRRQMLERGDHAHTANQPETVSCMNFKAPIKTKRLLLDLNHLHHT